MLEDIGQDVNGGRDVGVEGFGVVDSVFALLCVSTDCSHRAMAHTEVYALRWPPMFSISSSS